MLEYIMVGAFAVACLFMVGAFAVACLFMLVACLLPIISEPGKDGWDDVN